MFTDSIVLVHLFPSARHDLEFLASTSPEPGVDVLFGNDVADENVPKQEVVVHSIRNNFGHREMGKLEKGIVLGGTGLLSSESALVDAMRMCKGIKDTYLLVPRQPQPVDCAELFKVLLELILLEAPWQTPNEDDAGLGFL